MKDGNYDLCFSANGYTGRGLLVLEGKRARGGDDRYKFEGSLSDTRQNITANFNVLMQPRFIPNSRLPDHYSLQMTGTANDGDFSLIGTGPLGLIVEIDCSYNGPLKGESQFN